MEPRKSLFESKIRPLLSYIGAIGAAIMAVAYIICIFVLILGFKASKDFSQSILFATVNAVVGMIIMTFLKVQGVSFAENLPENVEILKQYYNTQTKDKKPHSITYFWITTSIKDIVVKGLSILITTAGIIYIVIEGSNDWNMLLLAFVNLLMFICFGLLSLTKAYDFYNNKHIPYIKLQLEKETENVRNQEGQSDDTITQSPGASSGEQGADSEALEC